MQDGALAAPPILTTQCCSIHNAQTTEKRGKELMREMAKACLVSDVWLAEMLVVTSSSPPEVENTHHLTEESLREKK